MKRKKKKQITKTVQDKIREAVDYLETFKGEKLFVRKKASPCDHLCITQNDCIILINHDITINFYPDNKMLICLYKVSDMAMRRLRVFQPVLYKGGYVLYGTKLKAGYYIIRGTDIQYSEYIGGNFNE